MRKSAILAAVIGALLCAAVPGSAKAWYSCHCYYHHYHHYIHYFHRHYVPYPNVFIENAHVYVPPYYYYSPYSYVDHVLVHRSLEVGPVVTPVVAKPTTTFFGITIAY